MQYQKIIEQSEYDNNGNSVEQTKYEIIGGKKKLYIYGYDYFSSTNRKLDVLYSYDLNNYKPFLTYFENKNVGKYIYHKNMLNKIDNQKIYEMLKKMFGMREEYKQEQESNNSACIMS
jgi:hypothetical protein